jgi:hypothetical protein
LADKQLQALAKDGAVRLLRVQTSTCDSAVVLQQDYQAFVRMACLESFLLREGMHSYCLCYHLPVCLRWLVSSCQVYCLQKGLRTAAAAAPVAVAVAVVVAAVVVGEAAVLVVVAECAAVAVPVVVVAVGAVVLVLVLCRLPAVEPAVDRFHR